MLKKQNGMTLVELLTTLFLSSLVIILIWTTVSISIKYNIAEASNLQMQQEANYIIADVQRIHRNYDCYLINIDEDGRWTSNNCLTGEIISVYSNLKYRYVLDAPSNEIYTKPIEGKKEEYKSSYKLTVKIFKLDNEKEDEPNLEVETVISRYVEG